MKYALVFQAYGSKISCENIILTVGFGPGKLRRSHMDSIHEGAPYVIAGKEYFQLGNPHIETKRVSYENPGLNFRTFFDPLHPFVKIFMLPVLRNFPKTM